MKSWAFSIATVLCAFFVQVSIGRLLAVGGVVPELVLVAVVLIGLSRGSATGAVMGFVGGLYQDLYHPSYLGLHCLAKTLVGFLAGEAGERLRREQPATQAAIFVVLTATHEVMRNLLSTGVRIPSVLGPLLLHDVLVVAYTAVVGVAAGTLGRGFLFGRTRFADSVTARRRVR